MTGFVPTLTRTGVWLWHVGPLLFNVQLFCCVYTPLRHVCVCLFVVFPPSCCECLARIFRRKKELKARTVWLGHPEKCEEKFPKNAIKNQKYNLFTFVPGVSSRQKTQSSYVTPFTSRVLNSNSDLNTSLLPVVSSTFMNFFYSL